MTIEAISATTTLLKTFRAYLMQMGWSVIMQKNVLPLFVHQTSILIPWFGWKSTSISMNHNLTQHKFMLMRHSSALFGKNTVKPHSHQLED